MAPLADHIARRVGSLGHTAYLLDVALEDRSLDPLHGCNGVILVASVSRASHEAEMIAFLRRNFDQITAWPSAFLSVSQAVKVARSSLAARSEQDTAELDVEAAADAFIEETGWEPGRVKPVPDAHAHTKYGLIRRWLLKGAGTAKGALLKRSPDPRAADPDELDAFVDDLVESLAHRGPPERLDLLMAHAPSRSAY